MKKAGGRRLVFDFKIAVIVILFGITFLHLYYRTAFPEHVIISDRILLFIALVLLGYLWVREIYDKSQLVKLNQDLVLAHEGLKKANFATLGSLFSTVEAKDPYTKGHCQRVTKYALAIAGELGFNPEEIRILKQAGMLHDIGKIAISDTILHKPGKLGDAEWKAIRSHPVKGLSILEPLDFISREKLYIRHHHERYDGKGYPDGLRGEAIPLGARVLAVADSFDAMNSKRPYRDPLPKEKILSELKNSRGTQLDPQIVDIFLETLQRHDEFWQRESTAIE